MGDTCDVGVMGVWCCGGSREVGDWLDLRLTHQFVWCGLASLNLAQF